MKTFTTSMTIGIGLVMLAGLAGCGREEGSVGADVEIMNVSYDPTRELYEEINEAFVADYKKTTGKAAKVTQSHGGSGGQARAVIDGLRADVLTLALASDIDAVAKKGLIQSDWETRLPANSSPYTSTIVFVVRKGNPRSIKDWPDLARAGVKVITPNPKTSGGARWNFLAAWGYVTIHNKGTEAEARELVSKIYRNVVKLDQGARGSSQSFVKNQLGDVFISWENEAYFAQKEVPDQKLEIVYPSVSILAEPPVAVVDRNVDERGTRATAQAYLKFLYSDLAQDIIGKHLYRPSNPAIQQKYAATLRPIPLFSIRDVTGSWADAQKKFFGAGGVFDEIYRGK